MSVCGRGTNVRGGSGSLRGRLKREGDGGGCKDGNDAKGREGRIVD